MDYLPKGLVGLLIASIFLAAWGSISAALNALAACSVIDFHVRFQKGHLHPDITDEQEEKRYHLSRYYTLAWGVFSVIVAEFAGGIGSLIEAVNILGSLFYGVMLGIFLVAFYLKHVTGNSVFIAAVFGELIVILVFFLDKYNIIGLGFLWLNVVGAVSVVLLSLVVERIWNNKLVKHVPK
jgi:solute:Na+ symporter, SSS family